jgi:CopA family copper-resistance protein
MTIKNQSLVGDVALSRRTFVTGLSAGGVLAGLGVFPNLSHAESGASTQPEILRGNLFELTLDYLPVNFTGQRRLATVVNGSFPAPTLVWREGERVTLRVKNNLAEHSSIHWHGIILPSEMDGVPGLSFAGIHPGETFEYSFDIKQTGTYWYHAHSGFQEQTGLFGAIVIEPRDGPVNDCDREHVVLLSDWTDENPAAVYHKLKKMSHYYNRNQRTLNDLYADIQAKGVAATWNERAMWNQMRMSDRDIADVTGATYTFLMNGNTPASGWIGLFKPGEKVKLRIINGAAMTIFDVRIPGLKMTVVASDGQDIEPVTVDEFRIGVAETYDVIVEPDGDMAYTLFAQTIDRNGYARGTLSSDSTLKASIPDLDPAPILGHGDMGMDHGDQGKSVAGDPHQGMDHSAHAGHSNQGMTAKITLGTGLAGFGSNNEIRHAATEYGPQVDMRVASPAYKLDDPGIGLRDHQRLYGRKVLTYADIKNRYKTLDRRQPEREIELHLTGNMHRYMWSVNGVSFADAEPIKLTYGERVRFTLVNDTMMTHPFHLHGMWSELENGDPDHLPRKHTVIVQPGAKVSYLVTADARGRWAYHCHLLYHMLGMFREVAVN